MIQQLIPTVVKECKKSLIKMINEPELFNSKYFSTKCEEWLSEEIFNENPVFMTSSGTRALELIAASIGLMPNDEIIFPTYTFVGTVNPFVQYGVNPVFIDVHPDSLCINIDYLKHALTKKTKAIVVVHYNGIAHDIDKIKVFADENNILLIEDNAQGFLCKFKNKFLGTFGDYSILSFNYTKNIQCGEGGALIVNNLTKIRDIEKLYNLGTNRVDFEKKIVKNYEWVGLGSKFYPSQLECAMLLPQLEYSKDIIKKRVDDWDYYYELFSKNTKIFDFLDLPSKISECEHSGHIFYIKVKKDRDILVTYLKTKNIQVYAHYTPLHLSSFGKKYKYIGDNNAKEISESILRLPIYNQINKEEINEVVKTIFDFYKIY